MEWIGVVGSILGILVAIGAIVAIVAAIVAKFRTDADERTLLLWKGEAEAQKIRGDRIEAEFAAHRLATSAQIEALTRRIEFLESEKRGQIREEILSAFSQLPCQIPRVEVHNNNG